MVTNKHISKIIVVVMAVAVLLCFLTMSFSDELTELLGGTGISMEYESKLFDTEETINIDIQMSDDDWSKMLANATAEEYYVCDVVINGKNISNVAIRPKGNTSLSAIAKDPDNDRYSFKIEFDHYVYGQSYYGLDKLILNNNYADATNMKEAVVYDMYQYLGADASLYNYAKVSVNGEYWGVYLALEAVEESFMLRNYGTQDGELYKPESMNMGGGGKGGDFSKPDKDFSDFDFSGFDGSGFEGMTPPSDSKGFSFNRRGSSDKKADDKKSDSNSEGSSLGRFPGGDNFNFDPGNMPNGGDFNFGGKGVFSMGGNGGANLNYTDDDLDSYSTIWEGEVTDTGKGDHRKVVTALKNISEGKDLEKYLDVDNVLKYMAVHTFVVNMDSLTGSMAHNYYLYEYDGQLNILPWDYNLSFGGMSMGSSDSASEMVNYPIDTPFSGTEFFDALLENEEYLERYHEYLQQLVDEYVNGGRFDEAYNRIRSQIDSLVETDPTALYSYEEYLTAADMLYQTIKLRAESISGQIKGTIPSTDEGQRRNSSALIDASSIDIKAMGQFNMGGNFGRPSEKTQNGNDSSDEDLENKNSSEEAANEITGEQRLQANFDTSTLPEGFDPSNMPDMGDFDPGNMPNMGDFDPSNIPNKGNFDSPSSGNDKGNNQDDKKQVEKNDGSSSKSSSSDRKMPSNFTNVKGNSKNAVNNVISLSICLAVMVIALIGVSLYKRKR